MSETRGNYNENFATKREDKMKDLKYEPEQIEEKTSRIYEEMLQKSARIDQPDFEGISTKDMSALFSLYDREFFDGFFQKKDDHEFRFRLSKRMTKSAGNTKFNKNLDVFVVSLSIPLLFQTFSEIDRDVNVNGITCTDRLEAAMHVFEHELIHVFECIHFGETSHKQPRFKRLAQNIFGHTEVTHQMVTQEERAAKLYGLKKGDEVVFRYDGKMHKGIISRITKRATVMVKDPDGGFEDESGNRFKKYYIPLPQLTHLEE